MKILLSNKYYYARGGADIHSIELEKLLKDNGHEVAFFSMQHPLNQDTEFSEFFPKEVDFNEKKNMDLISVFVRPFGSLEVRRKFTRLLESFRPDIVHFHNIHSQLSPVLAVLAHKRNIPVVWTVHDHKLLCPRYDCMRNGTPCELCFYNKLNVIKYKCMKNSMIASVAAYIESCVWNKKLLSRNTDLFLCPSLFLKNNMIKGGFSSDQLVHLPNFILDEKLSTVETKRGDYYCYIGRLSEEKGIETLLKASMDLPQYRLEVIGTGPLEQKLLEKYKADHIHFLGYQKWEEISEILGKSRCMVFPSECYENNPLSIIESLCLGTPVIGSRIGGIPELINPGVTGLTYESGNVTDLRNKIIDLFNNSSALNYSEIAESARSRFDSIIYYKNLIDIYNRFLK